MVSQDEKNTEPAQTPSAHARSQPLKQATWWGQSKTAGLWGNVSDTDWGEGAAWIADWVCKTGQLGLWARHSARLARLSLQLRKMQGFTGSHSERRQMLQELFAWIFNTAAVYTIKHPDIWGTLASGSHAQTFKDVSNYRSGQWWHKVKKANQY